MPDEIVKILLTWYDKNQRILPWRMVDGNVPNPYLVWLSEIMLQQTTVPTVIPYFYRFLEKWPSISDLARASRDEILHAWQGLGYYNRAHKLHECSILISQKYNNIFPSTYNNLLLLPGIGPYTAAAISSIAFNQPVPVVDGNVERLMARLYALQIPKKDIKKRSTEILQLFPLNHRPGDIAQSMMDFANSICTWAKPKCLSCPLKNHCKSQKLGIAEQLPKREVKKKPTRYAYFLCIERNHDKAFLFYKRPLKGLLPGLMGFPSTNWQPHAWPDAPAFYSQFLPNHDNIQWIDTPIQHTFTHFYLEARVGKYVASNSIINYVPFPNMQWIKSCNINKHALPTLMKKVAKTCGIVC